MVLKAVEIGSSMTLLKIAVWVNQDNLGTSYFAQYSNGIAAIATVDVKNALRLQRHQKRC
jgi:hypothetical protein